MSRAAGLAWLELRRLRSPLQMAGLAFLLCVPLLCGGIYLWSNWNPYGRLDRVPVAVVNSDRPVTVDGQRVDAGGQFAAGLRRNPLLGWRFVSASEASRGLRDGRYYAIITVPADFSARLSSGTPPRAAMRIRLDDANNYLVGIMAETVQSGLRRQIAAARILAGPVIVTTSNAHPARVYGRGLAPFFFAIALWVFGVVAFLLLRPVSGRLLASPASSGLVTLAAWLPVLATGTAAALILYAAVDLGLGLAPVSAAGTVALMVLGAAVSGAVIHVLRLAFGVAGTAIALVLLMLQLVSCGGLYPVQTLPLPFRALSRVLPMTYLVRALRVTISGGNKTIMWHAVLVLAGFGLVSLVLLRLVVGRQRVWTMRRLKPGRRSFVPGSAYL